MLRRLTDWIRRLWKSLLEIQASPEAIARGVSLGVVIGFSPLYSLKTLLAIVLAWIFRSSKLAAVIIVTLYDLLLPLEPLILKWQYDLGHRFLSPGGSRPEGPGLEHLFMHWQDWFKGDMLVHVIWPTLLGSLIMSVPLALLVYWPVKRLVIAGAASTSARNKPEEPRP